MSPQQGGGGASWQLRLDQYLDVYELSAGTRSHESLRSAGGGGLLLVSKTGLVLPSASAQGLLWSAITPHVMIPFVHSGRHPPSAWLSDYTMMNGVELKRRAVRRELRELRGLAMSDHTGVQVTIKQSTAKTAKVTAVSTKPNSKVELVVVNKHDRAALLKLLSKIDPAADVEAWLAARTHRKGSAQFKLLYDDYKVWCARRGQASAGHRSFAFGLLAAGVVKLKRRNSGEHYGVTLSEIRKR